MLFEVLERRALLAAVTPPQILKDINPGDASGLSAGVNASVSFKGRTYFAASDGFSGTELFASDGTQDGTSLVADLALYNASSNPRSFVVSGGKLFFIADWTRAYGNSAQAKLFVSDGTAAGTKVIENEPSYYYNNDPSNDLYGTITEPSAEPALVAYDGGIAFLAHGAKYSPYYPDNTSNRLLWITDGTAAGTSFRVLNGAPPRSVITHLTPAGKNLFFTIKGDRSSYGFDGIGVYDGNHPYFTAPPVWFYDSQTIEELVPAGSAAYVRTKSNGPASGRLYHIEATGVLSGGTGPYFGISDVLTANGRIVASAVLGYSLYGDDIGEITQTLFDVTKASGVLQFSPLTTFTTFLDQPAELTAVGKYIYFAHADLNSYFYRLAIGRFDITTNQRNDVTGTNGYSGFGSYEDIAPGTPGSPAFVQGPDGGVYFQAVPVDEYTTRVPLLYRISDRDTGLTVEPFVVSNNALSMDLRPSGLMTIGNNWYAPGTTEYEGREWRLVQQPMGRIHSAIYEAFPGQTSPAYGLEAASGVVPYIDANNNGQLDIGEPASAIDYNGRYAFSNLPAGQHRLRLSTPAGTQFVSPASGAMMLVDVPEDGFASPPAFILRIRKPLTAQLFNDLDGDNVRDTGEAALAGRTVFLDTNTNGTLDTGETSALTDANGLATFNVYDGTYQVRQVLPAGWRFTQYAAVTKAVTAGVSLTVPLGSQVITQYDSGVSGTLFNDANGNGIQDFGDLALAGRTVFDDRNNNGLLNTGERSAVSSSSGFYFIGTHEPGSHTVRQLLPAGWDQTTPTPGTGHTVDVVAHTGFSGRHFGSRPTPVPPANSPTVLHEAETAVLTGGTAKGSVNTGYSATGYADYGGSGSAVTWTTPRNATEQATLTFRYANGSTANRPLTIIVNGVTVGTLAFAPTGSWATWRNVSISANLLAGTNTIKAVAGAATGANVDCLTITRNGLAPPVDTATLEGFLFEDTNKSGWYEFGEPRPSGRVVFLDTDNDGVKDAGEPSIVTTFDGEWAFSGLPTPGTYRVRQVLASGTVPSKTLDLVLDAGGQSISGLSIGSKTGTVPPPPPPPPPPAGTASLSGSAFRDNNKNGRYDTGDGIGKAITVFLDSDNDGLLDGGETRVVTDTAGKFKFAGLAAGTYRVRAVLPAGSVYSTTRIDQALTSGQAKSGLLIGLRTP
ncbi:MAG TPA: SdrD B-like domain-containing protein [Tepidisphaeraceae bacterium]|jgi:ELWxxDGT repeat protein